MMPLKDAAARATGLQDLLDLPPQQRAVAVGVLVCMIIVGLGLWYAAQPPDMQTVAEEVVRSPALVQAIEEAAPKATLRPGQTLTLSCRPATRDQIHCTVRSVEQAAPP